MKKTVLSMALVAAVPAFAQEESAAPTLYGKANVAWQASDENGESFSELVSNASRIGVKGSLDLDNGIKGIYQAEFGVEYDDSDTFSQRNIFAGLEGNFGQVIAGKFDTPFKKAQKKVDLFSDLEGDIKSVISNSENRPSNSVQYTSPKYYGMQFIADVVNSEQEDVDNAYSMAVTWSGENAYVAYAQDTDVEGLDVTASRLAAQYDIGAFQLGALVENEQDDTAGTDNDGYMASLAYKVNAWTLKAQGGKSDIVAEGGKTYSLGADYKMSSKAKVYAYLTDESFDLLEDRQYVGIGTEFKF